MNTKTQMVLLALIVGLCARLLAEEPAKNPGLSFISVGNSHANLLRLLDPLAKAVGHPQHRNEEIYILGAPLRWNWHELKLLNGQGSIQGSLAAGKLPGGLTLSERGLLEGKTEQVGASALVLRAQAGNGTVERALQLEVAADKPLAIRSPDFGKVGLDGYILKELKADGGVGHKTWTVTTGKLPYGLRVLSSGMIDGTPGEAGEFAFTVRAANSHPAGSRTAERAIMLTVGPAAPDTLPVKKVPFKAVTEDATITEPFWNFDQPVSAKIGGQPVKKAAFSAVWEDADPRNAKKTTAGRGLWVVVKVLDGPAGPSKKDGVHIYIDGRHNREIIYNADDMHFFIPRNQKPGAWAPVVRGMRANWFTKAFVQEIPGGYCVRSSCRAATILAARVIGCRSAPRECMASTWRSKRKPDVRPGAATGRSTRTPVSSARSSSPTNPRQQGNDHA